VAYKKATVVVGVRVSPEAKAALDADGDAKRQMFEAVGLALANGKSYADVIAAMRGLMSNAKEIAEEIREAFRDESNQIYPPAMIGFLIDAVAVVIAKHLGPAPKSD
jgi:hypothetical protein